MLIERAPAAKHTRIPLWLRIAGLVLAGLIVAGIVVLATHWPFSKSAVERALRAATDRPVRIGTFHQSFFPPGCVAEDITVLTHHGGENPPLIAIRKLVIQGSLTGMFSSPKRLAEVKIVGMHLRIPPKRPGENHGIPLDSGGGGHGLAISKIVADGALLEFIPADRGKEHYKLLIDKLLVRDVGSGKAMSYRAVLTNTEPPGVIRSEGKFGPWNPDDPGRTQVSGAYTYENVKLGVFGGISGTAHAHGKFAGRLDHILTDGTVEIPNFHVNGSALDARFAVDYHALVNGTNGDTRLEPANARFLRTEVATRGPIEGGAHKTATFGMTVRGGRLEDLLRLFISDRTSPMSGSVTLEAKAVWPPGPRKFLDKLRLDIDFGIGSGRFDSTRTQGSIDRLSESAAGESRKEEKEDPRTVLSNLRGHVALRDGVAHFSNVSFAVPGAAATLHGTYRLSDQAVDLHGVLDTQGRLSDTASGFKALMLKVITPFFKKEHSVRIVPFKITGSWGNATVGLD
jgi:hypothetical protein